METAPRVGTRRVLSHSSATTAKEPRAVEAARISIYRPHQMPSAATVAAASAAGAPAPPHPAPAAVTAAPAAAPVAPPLPLTFKDVT